LHYLEGKLGKSIQLTELEIYCCMFSQMIFCKKMSVMDSRVPRVQQGIINPDIVVGGLFLPASPYLLLSPP